MRSGKTAGPTIKPPPYIDSYQNLPFVDLHTVYASIRTNRSIRLVTARVKEDKHWTEWVYTFDYPGKAMYIEQKIWKSSTRR